MCVPMHTVISTLFYYINSPSPHSSTAVRIWQGCQDCIADFGCQSPAQSQAPLSRGIPHPMQRASLREHV